MFQCYCSGDCADEKDCSQTADIKKYSSDATVITNGTAFTCNDELVISTDLKCNKEPDCRKSVIYDYKTKTNYHKFEDEFGCNHEIGIECKFDSTSSEDEDAEFWVPPLYLCDGYTLCDGGEDEANCSKAFDCEKNGSRYVMLGILTACA